MTKIAFIDILETDRAVIEKVRQWRNRDDIRKMMVTQHLISEDEHAGWLAALKNRNDCKFWVIFVDGAPVGAAYLHNIDYQRSRSEWGFYIGETSHRGKGIGKRALFKLLEIFFCEMKFKELITKVLSGNAVALGMYKKLDFKEIGRSNFKDGEEIIILQLDRDRWIKMKAFAGEPS